ncbi:MAG: TIGR00341 family protein [Patescibacteria group bacterium]|nr:TIGR00341 family protein [Patescibacteria group bacterium]
MRLFIFNGLEERDKADAVEKLITQSTPSQDFFLMMALSVLTAVFGVLLGNVAIVIGSMLIAPLLSPILSLSLGITIADSKLIRRSIQTIVKSLTVGVGVSAVATLIFGAGKIPENLVVSSNPSLLYVAVSVVAGFAATFALIKPKLNETLPGVAIAVALIPPIALIGIGLAEMSWTMMTNALILFGLNIVGIIFAGMVTFSLMNFHTKKKVIETIVTKEDKRLEKEEPKET